MITQNMNTGFDYFNYEVSGGFNVNLLYMQSY